MSGVQDNIDHIRLQRELKEKANQYTELHAKFHNIFQQHQQLKDNHDHLLEEVERYNQQLKHEQQRNITLKTEIKNMSQSGRQIMELKERLEDVSRENEAIKEANQNLLNNAFNLERERDFRERERILKVQIAQLEATLKSDVGEKGTILDRLNAERDQYDKLNTEMKDNQLKYYEMKQKYDEMNEKMMFLSKVIYLNKIEMKFK
jgi:protein fantom